MLNVLLTIPLKLDITKPFIIASIRTIVQLIFIGFMLKSIFSLESPWATFSIVLVMTLVATLTGKMKIFRGYKGMSFNNFFSIALPVWSMTILAIYIVGPTPWHSPQYLIPFAGMVMGNSLNAITLGVDRFHREISSFHWHIQAQLAYGATTFECIRQSAREALKASTTPILNTMSIVGLVSLPGMMTGQILAGANPMEAAKYQIMIMFLIVTAVVWGSLMGVFLSKHFLFRKQGRYFLLWLQEGNK